MGWWEWFGTWTFFNWLSLASAIVLPLSALNAFLGLKSRWKDWRATKNKKSFEKRLKELEYMLSIIEKFYKSWNDFILYIIGTLIVISNNLIVALLIFILSYILASIPIKSEFAVLPLILCTVLLINAIRMLFNLHTIVGYFRSPLKLANEIIGLVSFADKHKWIDKDNQVITKLLDRPFFTESEKTSLSQKVDKLGLQALNPNK